MIYRKRHGRRRSLTDTKGRDSLVPRLVRRLKRAARLRTVSSGMLSHLETGHDFSGGFGRENVDRDAMRKVWNECRDDLIQATIQKEGPGHRPWAWWEFAAPEPRQIVKMVVQELRVPCASLAGRYGIPFDGLDGLAIYESQAEYLKRLGLLTESERSLLHLEEA